VTTTAVVDYRYRDPDRSVDERVQILLGQMTVEEKAGLLFHSMILVGQDGGLAGPMPAFSLPDTREMVRDQHLSHFNFWGKGTDAATIAGWHNQLQELAASTRLGIPISLSTDPRHGFTDNIGASMPAGAFSEWPETMGLAAIGDEKVVEQFADIVRQEYLAVGLRVALHPQIDLATEPRWARQVGTFGADAELTSRLGAAYIRGLQRMTLGRDSVATLTKHFPGGGPQLDGEDPHFAYGREQVYPGGRFEYHLKPFEAAFEVGVSQIMPYYGIPVGTEYEEVGFGFNKSIITGLLRERYGFDGIVCTDWGLLTDQAALGDPFPARAWGVEHLTPAQRVRKALEAGVDQFGGERATDLVIELVRGGEISGDRLDQSVRRLLREKFVLGLFDDPYVDVEAAAALVGCPEFRAAGAAAQRASLTLLTNRNDLLPLDRGVRLYVDGIDPEVAARYGTVVDTPAEADVAIVRTAAPYEQRPTAFENRFHAGSLDFPAETLDRLTTLARTVPTVIDVFLDRPAILTPLVDEADALVGNFGASSAALLDVLFGAAEPLGRLPVDLPSSMAAVRAGRPDVPFDTADPLFRFGHGLRYSRTDPGPT
jgi:beta-glucosidase